MPHPLTLIIKESLKELRELHKRSNRKLQPRIQMLILLKKEKEGLSKTALAECLGVNHNSVQQWRSNYRKGGLQLLLSDKRGGNRKSVIKKNVHNAIKKRLTTPQGAIRSYTELKQWVEQNFDQKVCYTTLNGYVKRKFGAKLKVARKSHIRKSEGAVKAFKKNGFPDGTTVPEKPKKI